METLTCVEDAQDFREDLRNWKETRLRILARANNRCEFCGVINHEIGYRKSNGKFVYGYGGENNKTIKIVLTIAHLDHDETNHDVKDERLKALCQKCHLGYDAKEKARRRRNFH